MRVSLDWLGEWVDLPAPDALCERLDLGGFEDTEIEQTLPDISGIRVGHVLERGPHPNADRLSVCRVDVGGGEEAVVVCGAPNVAAGQKVAIALPGAHLPDGAKLERARIRGVASNGMLCSAQELGIGDDQSGILVLDPDAQVGAPLTDVVSTGARILEVGITPNRGDTASILGLAREVRAHFGGTIRMPETDAPESGAPASDAVEVQIDVPSECHRYVARIVRGVRIGPSPDWLRERLEASGVRAINVVVDVTNFVLLEYGQPLHAFDLPTLRGARVRVRRAEAGEKLVALDGSTLDLSTEDMVIADAERPIALAGVMGGRDTEVGDRTRDVLIESAHFHPTPVRLSARRHGLRTEASYRFERGVDRDGIRRAADRAARLLAELAGGEVGAGAVEAAGDPPSFTEAIRLETTRTNKLLGTGISDDEIRGLLARVGVEAEPQGPGVLHCGVPSHRNDLHLHQDLTEEVARIYGYERIPTTEPLARLHDARLPRTWELSETARDTLAAAGLVECVSPPFVAPADLERLGLPEDDPRTKPLRLANPIRDEEPCLRTTLLPSLLRMAVQNRSRQVDEVRIFEVSRVFRARGAGELPNEPLQVAALVTRGDARALWAPDRPPPLFYELKGIAERLLLQMGYVARLQQRESSPVLHPGAAVRVEVDGRIVGVVGEVHPEIADAFGLDVPAALVELDLTALDAAPRIEPRYRDVSRFPQVRRDLAVILERSASAGDVAAAIEMTGGPDLVSVELFDRYEGKGVPSGRVSLAFRLVFQRSDRTLRDAEVADATERVVNMLTERFGGELRHGAAGSGGVA